MAIAFERTVFAWGVGALCQWHRLPFDAESLLKRVLPPYDSAVLQRLMRDLGFKTVPRCKPQANHYAIAFPILFVLNLIKPAAGASSDSFTPDISVPKASLVARTQGILT